MYLPTYLPRYRRYVVGVCLTGDNFSREVAFHFCSLAVRTHSQFPFSTIFSAPISLSLTLCHILTRLLAKMSIVKLLQCQTSNSQSTVKLTRSRNYKRSSLICTSYCSKTNPGANVMNKFLHLK